MQATKTIKIYTNSHRKLKLHVVKNEVNMTDFVSQAVEEKIRADKLSKRILQSEPQTTNQ